MARFNRSEVLDPDAIDSVHVYNRVVRRCLLFGEGKMTSKNYDHHASGALSFALIGVIRGPTCSDVLHCAPLPANHANRREWMRQVALASNVQSFPIADCMGENAESSERFSCGWPSQTLRRRSATKS